jgi:hypothetical protein
LNAKEFIHNSFLHLYDDGIPLEFHVCPDESYEGGINYSPEWIDPNPYYCYTTGF